MQKLFFAVVFATMVVVQAQSADLEDVSEKPIPNKPAAGKVQGRELVVKNATLVDGTLKLWQGEGFNSLEQFEVDLTGKAVENFSGKTFTVKLDESPGIDVTEPPHVSRTLS